MPVDTQPTVTFSEPVDPATVTASTVQLIDLNGQPVAQAAGSPTLSADGLVATIRPANDLAQTSNYRIRVIGQDGGVKDLAGNPLAATFTQPNGFTTENLPPSQVSNVRRSDVR